MLERMANLFEVPVATLLGSNIQEEQESPDMREVAKQLSVLNEHMAKQSRFRKRLLKTLLIVFVLIPVAVIILTISSIIAFRVVKSNISTEETYTAEIRCTLDGEEYLYEVTYDDQYRILSAGGDAWIANHVQVEQYDNANVLIAQIEDYFMMRDGSVKITREEPWE